MWINRESGRGQLWAANGRSGFSVNKPFISRSVYIDKKKLIDIGLSDGIQRIWKYVSGRFQDIGLLMEPYLLPINLTQRYIHTRVCTRAVSLLFRADVFTGRHRNLTAQQWKYTACKMKIYDGAVSAQKLLAFHSVRTVFTGHLSAQTHLNL